MLLETCQALADGGVCVKAQQAAAIQAAASQHATSYVRTWRWRTAVSASTCASRCRWFCFDVFTARSALDSTTACRHQNTYDV